MNEKNPSPHGTLWIFFFIVLGLFALAVLYFNKNSPALKGQWQPSTSASSTRNARAYVISYKNGVFSPTNLQIRVGDSVAFRNDDVTPIAITTPAGDNAEEGNFDSGGDIAPGDTYVHAFSSSGIFSYTNIRDSDEKGTIIVNP